jgi:microcystin degradation protein MlrC
VDAGEGAELSLWVGGKVDTIFSKPVQINARVLRIVHREEGNRETAAVLRVNGITLVLLNWHMAFTDPAHFSQVHIDPLAHKIVVVKEGYLFQGLRDIAPHAIMALTPGFANQMMSSLEYNEVRRPIYPLDPGMSWSAEQSNY